MDRKRKVYDLIIIGGGPAGLSAGTYAARSGLKALVIEAETLGGSASQSSLYENFPGFPQGILGKDLIEKMEKQASKFNAEIKHVEEVIDLDLESNLKKVTTKKATYHSLAILIAIGTQRRKLEILGENELLGRGVSYCRLCDGPFFKGLSVAVIGFTEEAIIDALSLAEIAKEVLLITHKEELIIAKDLRRRLQEKTNIQMIHGSARTIEGKNVVEAIRIVKFDDRQEIRIDINGIFISLGKVPLTGIVKKAGIEVDDKGCIKIDRWQRTNIDGVFAAGDCTCGGMQVVTAIGEGAMASIKAVIYIKGIEQLSTSTK